MSKSKGASNQKTHKLHSKEEAIHEAYRYLENAKETLSKSPIEYGTIHKDGFQRAREIVDMLAK